MEKIKTEINESIKVKHELLENCVGVIKQISDIIVASLKNGNFLYLMGNGGSAADAQHIAGELVGRFKRNRKAVPALSFATDTSVITAIANDFGYDDCFVRQVDAFVKRGDVVLGISTSGNSPGVIKAMELAKEKGAHAVALTGSTGGVLCGCVDLCLKVPSDDTPRIQECHIMVGHILCSMLEEELFG